MAEKQHIGQLVEIEVRRQGLTITGFAGKICTTRQNVYNIFKREEINFSQLKLISKVLKHNFLTDITCNTEILEAETPAMKKYGIS